MKSTNIRNEPFPYKSLWSILPAFFLTLVVILAITPLRKSPYSFLYNMIRQRGPCAYMILFASFAVIVPMLVVRLRRKPVSVEFLLACGAGSLLPAAFGALGTILGLVGANAGYADYMQDKLTVETFIEAQTQLAMARAVALDPLMLGVTLTVMLLVYCICMMHKNMQLRSEDGASETSVD